MFHVTFVPHSSGENFNLAARSAIADSFGKYQSPPAAVLVPAGLTPLKQISITLGNPSKRYVIPVQVKPDVLQPNTFGIDETRPGPGPE